MSLEEQLIEASCNGDLNRVKQLVEQGADIHACNNGALYWASMKGHLDVIKYLVEAGADICILNNQELNKIKQVLLSININNYKSLMFNEP